MSIALMNAAWSIEMAASRKMVLLALCDWSNDEGTSCHPSVRTIAKRASLSERQAQRVIHGLIEDGWVEVIGGDLGGRGVSRQYRINVDAVKKGDILSSIKPSSQKGDILSKGDIGDRVFESKRVTLATEKGDTHVTQTTNKPKAPPYSPPKGTKPQVEQEQQKLDSPETGLTTTTADRSLAEITRDAIAGYNAVMAKPNGLLPAASLSAGIERRRQMVKRSLRTIRKICQQEFGSPIVTSDFWEAYWAECDRDDFTSGRQPPGRGHENWTPSFDYLIREKVVLEVFEKALARTGG